MKNLVARFNKNPNIEDFKNILNLHFCDHNVCITCSEPIYYSDTRLKYSIDKGLSIIGKSEYSTKQIENNTYNLCRCEKCVIAKYPEYLTKNKSRIFNTIQPIVLYAYGINESKFSSILNNRYAITLEKLILKHGESLGNSKWKEYCDKQAYSNSLEYKSDKYGWTSEDFNNYNNSRSITYENCISRHGYEKGLDVWNNYREKQKVNGCSLGYFQSLYGLEQGLIVYKKVCSEKANNFENFVKRYGSLAESKWLEYLEKIYKNIKSYSNISQKLFLRLDEYLKPYNLTTYYYTKNKEYGKNIGYKYVYLDYYIKELNLCIEFYGTIFHADPLLYSANDNPLYFDKTVVASDLWVKDANRIQSLKDLYNIDTLVIWESEIINKGIETICKELTLIIDTKYTR